MTTNSEIVVSVRKKCYECYECNFQCQTEELLDDHMAIHSIPSMKPFWSFGMFCGFKCTICNMDSILINSHANAIEHAKLHQQFEDASPMLNTMNYSIINEHEIICRACYSTNFDLMDCCAGALYIEKYKHSFNSVPEFIDHFITEHIMTPPRIIKFNWKPRDRSFKIEQCSFCGCINNEKYCSQKNWWSVHNCRKSMQFEKIYKDLIAKENIISFVACFMRAQTESMNCLQIIDEKIMKKIAERMV